MLTGWVKVIDGFVKGLTASGIHIKDGIRQATAWTRLQTIRLAIEANAPRPITLDEIKSLQVGDAAAKSTYEEFQRSLTKHHGVREADWPPYFHMFEFREKTKDADMFEEVVKLLVRPKLGVPNAGTGE